MSGRRRTIDYAPVELGDGFDSRAVRALRRIRGALDAIEEHDRGSTTLRRADHKREIPEVWPPFLRRATIEAELRAAAIAAGDGTTDRPKLASSLELALSRLDAGAPPERAALLRERVLVAAWKDLELEKLVVRLDGAGVDPDELHDSTLVGLWDRIGDADGARLAGGTSSPVVRTATGEAGVSELIGSVLAGDEAEEQLDPVSIPDRVRLEVLSRQWECRDRRVRDARDDLDDVRDVLRALEQPTSGARAAAIEIGLEVLEPARRRRVLDAAGLLLGLIDSPAWPAIEGGDHGE